MTVSGFAIILLLFCIMCVALADLYTVLMATCGANSQKGEVLLESVTLLIDKGADVNTRDR